jgi:hyperosmotically inducible protein
MKVTNTLRKAFLVLAGVLSLSAVSLASPRDRKAEAIYPAAVSSDQQLANKVAGAIRGYPYFSIFDWVTGTVKDGVVTLNGSVHVPGRQEEFARIAAKVPGVTKVINDLKVLPNSPFDDQLRMAAARAIYRDSNFLDLANQPNPPVHIIVEHGQVRLEGMVTNKMQRQLAEMDVRSRTMAFDVVNDLAVES